MKRATAFYQISILLNLFGKAGWETEQTEETFESFFLDGGTDDPCNKDLEEQADRHKEELMEYFSKAMKDGGPVMVGNHVINAALIASVTVSYTLKIEETMEDESNGL